MIWYSKVNIKQEYVVHLLIDKTDGLVEIYSGLNPYFCFEMKNRILTLILFICTVCGYTQSTIVEGIVTDSVTGKGIPFVKVKHQYSGIGAFTDTAGYYFIKTNQPSDTLEFVCTGYKTVKVSISPGIKQTINIQLKESAKSLTEVVVEAGDNPAWRILDSVRAHRAQNDPEMKEAYQCEVYNKLQFDVNNMSDKFQDRKVFEDFDFIMDYMDSVDGEKYLPCCSLNLSQIIISDLRPLSGMK
jgi:hypothetical protein